MRKQKTPRQKAVALADKHFSEYIRRRDRRCVCCGSTNNLQCGHLFSRKNYSTRWEPLNAYCQCSGCNLRHEYDPYTLTSYFIDLYGKEAYDDLHLKHVTPKKYTTAEILQIAESYKRLEGEL